MSIWSKLFPSKTEDTSINPKAASESNQSPESALAKSLQKAADERAAEIEATHKLIEQQLRAWGETDTNIVDTEPPFQDPLGHLTFEQQKEYFANPPPEYLQSLRARARAREQYDMTLFQADPWTHWQLSGYQRKPDFFRVTLPPWRRWRKDQFENTMEKFKRYDIRFQTRVQSFYEKFDAEKYRNKVRDAIKTKHAVIAAKAAKVAKAAKKAEKRVKKKKGGKAGSTAVKKEDEDEDEELNGGPPQAVIEHKVYRQVLLDRNNALRFVWFSHMRELQQFDDISEDGKLASDIANKELQDKKAKERSEEEAFGDWTHKPTDEKIKSVDWATIHKEL
jgi:hypothetical protein